MDETLLFQRDIRHQTKMEMRHLRFQFSSLAFVQTELVVQGSKDGFNLPTALVGGEQFLFGQGQSVGSELFGAVSDNQCFDAATKRSLFHPVGMAMKFSHWNVVKFSVLLEPRDECPTVGRHPFH